MVEGYCRRIGARIKYFRERRGLTQSQLATLIGYQQGSMISQIESGDKRPSNEKLDKLAEVLQVPTGLLTTALEFSEDDVELAIKLTLMLRDHSRHYETVKALAELDYPEKI